MSPEPSEFRMIRIEVRPGDVRMVRPEEEAGFRAAHGLPPRPKRRDEEPSAADIEAAVVEAPLNASLPKAQGRKVR